MITRVKDINYIIDILGNTEDIFPEPIEEEVSSDNFNKAFKTIEYQLNRLYEKTRLLEDLNEFTREYVYKEIGDRKERLKDQLKIIEDVSDTFRDTDFVAIMVKFTNPTEVVTDRDGSILPYMDNSHHVLDAPGELLGKGIIDSISRKSPFTVNENTYDNLKQGITGKSVYILEEPAKNGITEHIDISLKNPDYYNYIKVVPLNADLTRLKIVNASNSEELVDKDSSYLQYKYISSIKFDLLCKNYEIKKESIPLANYANKNKEWAKKEKEAYEKYLTNDELSYIKTTWSNGDVEYTYKNVVYNSYDKMFKKYEETIIKPQLKFLEEKGLSYDEAKSYLKQITDGLEGKIKNISTSTSSSSNTTTSSTSNTTSISNNTATTNKNNTSTTPTASSKDSKTINTSTSKNSDTGSNKSGFAKLDQRLSKKFNSTSSSRYSSSSKSTRDYLKNLFEKLKGRV